MTAKVTVIIPLYNKEMYIAETLDSVFAQTFQDFELIVVNDGSTDNSLKIVESYSHDSRLHIITQTNHGLSATRNRGIREANTELLAFLDADDTWGPEFLETVCRLYDLYPDAGFYGTAFSVYSADTHVRDIVQHPELGERVFDSYFGEWIEANHPIIIASGFAARKTALWRVGYYREDLRAGQDHDLFSRVALYYDVAYSPKVCLQYNIGTVNNGDITNYVIEVPLEKYLRDNPDEISNYICNPSDLQEYREHWIIRTGGRNIYSGFRKEGRAQIIGVKSKRYKYLRLGFLVLSYLPIPVSKIPPNKVRALLRIFNLSI